MNAHAVRKRMKPDDRRAQLLDCGLVVFARLGIGRGSHAEVAREAGVSVATAFNYFPSRENLVDEILGQIDQFLTEMVAKTIVPGKPASQALYDLVHAFAEAADTHPEIIRVWLEWSTSIRDETWTKYLDFQERVIAGLRQAVQQGKLEGTVAADVDPEDAARIVVGDAHMVALMHFSRRTTNMDRFLRHMVDSALKIPSRDNIPG